MHSVTGLHIYYFFGHLCDYQLRRNITEKRPPIEDPGVLLLLEQGRRNEDLYVERLGDQVVSLKQGAIEERAERTLAAMREGVRVIHNGILEGGSGVRALAAKVSATGGVPVRFRGETDLLFRVDGVPSAFGDWSYLVADVKSSRTSRLPQMMQVAFYDWLLRDVQESSVGRGSIVVFPQGPQGEPVEEPFDLADLEPSLVLYLEEQLPRALAQSVEETPRRLGRDCRRCLWFAHCEGDAASRSGLELVAGLRGRQRKFLGSRDVSSIASFARLDDERLLAMAQASGAGGEGLLRSRAHARAIADDEITERAPAADVLADWLLETNRTLAPDLSTLLPVYVDVATDHLGGIHYAFGVRVGSHPVQLLFAEEPGAEGEQVNRFADGLRRVDARTNGRYVLYGAGGTERAFRLLAEKYADTCGPTFEQALARLVDPAAILRRAWWFPLFITRNDRQLSLWVEKGGRAVSRRPRDVESLSGALADAGCAAGEVEAGLAAIARQSERMGIDVEKFLAADSLAHACYRLHLEDGDPVWLRLVRMELEEGLDELTAAVQLLHERMAGAEVAHA